MNGKDMQIQKEPLMNANEREYEYFLLASIRVYSRLTRRDD
ncbi:hypothetical protein KsCSTR_39030 [Candidatus Kuenenia stuttgartiensis]|uniref:Uncharacterized protein n=1 Tax=Kuenenia stuttgartiensis TaxID=174633 RepID=A0A6G7GVA3_KUEST|nr:hypothetical protein KsCSTR_39030 [Candidatus Kuenenia stuttgartiensis]